MPGDKVVLEGDKKLQLGFFWGGCNNLIFDNHDENRG